MPTGTPTTTATNYTAVISGLTLTSVYANDILHNITIYTVQGYESSIGSRPKDKAVYNIASSLPNPHYFTILHNNTIIDKRMPQTKPSRLDVMQYLFLARLPDPGPVYHRCKESVRRETNDANHSYNLSESYSPTIGVALRDEIRLQTSVSGPRSIRR